MNEIKSLDEIEQMLYWLSQEISKMESWLQKPLVGSAMSTWQCWSFRMEYAGLIAERDFLINLKKKHYGEASMNDIKPENTFIDSAIRSKLKEMRAAVESLEKQAKDLVAGRRAVIIGNYNGQLYGSSRKSMKGKTVELRGAGVDDYHGVYLWIKDECVSISIDDVEFL